MMFLRFLTGISPSAVWSAMKGIYKAARAKVKTGKVPKNVTLPTGTWAQRFWSAMFSVLMVREIVDLFTGILSKGMGLGLLAFLKVAPDHATDVVEWCANQIISFEPLAARLAASTMQSITGVPIAPETLKPVGTPAAGRARAINLGGEFMQVVTSIFSVPAAIEDFKTRTGITGSAENLASYFGTNLFFQLRSLTISTVASLSGWHTLRHLEQLHQSVNWAFGFGWLSWAVMSEFMNVTINPGMRRYLNGQVKPNDMNEAEARWAFWAGRLTAEAHGQIMDNQGVRLDIRQALLDRAEADLSDSDMSRLYKMQRITQADILKAYRLKGFGEQRAKLKTALIIEEDLSDILDKIDQGYLNLYRDCVIDRLALEQWLQQRGWSQAKINASIALEEIERRQRKWLSQSQLDKAFDLNIIDMDEVYDQLTCQGMTGVDAVIAITLMVEQKLPKDCWDKIGTINFKKGFATLLALLTAQGNILMPAQLLALLKCLGITEFPELPGPGEEGGPPAPKLPTGSISALPSSPTVGEQFRLVWNIANADTVSIDQGIGVVAPQGTLFLTAAQSTVWKLTASNEDGQRTFQASILAKPLPAPKPLPVPKPTVSFSVSPSSVSIGDLFVVQWETNNATQVFLDDGTGARAVALSGAKFLTAERSGVFTLTASGTGGQASRSDTLLVRPAAAPRVALPTATLSITPGQVTIGDQVEVRWSSSNASRVTLEWPDRIEVVSPVGARVITAVTDLILTLRAANPEEGTERVAQDVLIVEPAAAAALPTAAAPLISLNIRPGTAKKGQEVAIEWRSSNAHTVTLQRAAGTTTVDPVGATTMRAEATEIIILHAKGAGGEKAIAKVLMVV